MREVLKCGGTGETLGSTPLHVSSKPYAHSNVFLLLIFFAQFSYFFLELLWVSILYPVFNTCIALKKHLTALLTARCLT